MIGKIGLTIAIAFNVALLALSHGHMSYGYELRGNLWEPGKQILHGNSPYDLETPKRALAEGRTDCCIQALYPAPTHVFFSPLSLLPFGVAMAIFTLVSAACLIAGLWLLGTRSSAAYGLILLLPPVWTGTQVASIMPFLVLGCALSWRWRDRPYLGGLAVAATAVLKIFLWPLWLWLLFTRRYRAAIVAATAAVGMLLAGWAVFGFQDLLDYPRLLLNVTKLEQGHSIGLVRFGGEWLALAVFVALVAVGRRSFSVMIIASLVLLPIVWVHTLQVLLVPAALAFNQPETLGRLRRLVPRRPNPGGLPTVQPAER
jgi:Glycosyltransferase family 87